MTNEQAAALEYPFTADEIEWRILRTTKDKTKGQVAAFIDSRAIQKRLDTVLGRENWQNHLCTVPGKDNAGTAHICEISIYYASRGEWIRKSDGAGSTDIEPIKGGLSNAFKRAASMWGIGRYLYALKNIWVPLKEGKYIPDDEFPRLAQQYNRFVVKYLSSTKQPADKKQTENVTVQTSSVSQTGVQQSAPLITQGRFATEQPAHEDTWKITDLKVSKGGSGAQTLVTLQKPTGEFMSGYIRDEAPLTTGQNIRDLKITKKTSPIVGDYNIVESYQMAA